MPVLDASAGASIPGAARGGSHARMQIRASPPGDRARGVPLDLQPHPAGPAAPRRLKNVDKQTVRYPDTGRHRTSPRRRSARLTRPTRPARPRNVCIRDLRIKARRPRLISVDTADHPRQPRRRSPILLTHSWPTSSASPYHSHNHKPRAAFGTSLRVLNASTADAVRALSLGLKCSAAALSVGVPFTNIPGQT